MKKVVKKVKMDISQNISVGVNIPMESFQETLQKLIRTAFAEVENPKEVKTYIKYYDSHTHTVYNEVSGINYSNMEHGLFLIVEGTVETDY